MDTKTNQLINEIKENIKAMKDLKDPYKADGLYLKKPGFGIVAKITEHASIEVYAGGSIETREECPEVAILNFDKRGFEEITKEEYDAVVMRAVREINALV